VVMCRSRRGSAPQPRTPAGGLDTLNYLVPRRSSVRRAAQSRYPNAITLPVNSHVPFVDDLIYDVGLHKGEDAAFYLAKGYRVVAFEANLDLISTCKQRFSSEIAAGRLTIVEGAITASSAPTVRFYKHPISTWGTTTEEVATRNLIMGKSEPVDVPAVNFAAVLRDTGMPSFMKIDIEGSDRVCLETLLGFERRPQSLSVESHKTDWARLEGEFSLLEQLGYDRFAVVQQGTIPGREILTRTLDGSQLRFRFEEDASGAFGSDVGPWMDRSAAIARYRRVFLAYRLIGADSFLRKTRLGRALHGAAVRHLGRPVPGWFDTHAARSTDLSAPTFVNLS
jgi:FkbM family methyltransferase